MNQTRLTASIVEIGAVRLTPAGVPALDARLEHESEVEEGGSSRQVKALRKEARELKEVVAEQTLELRILKKSMIADGGDDE